MAVLTIEEKITKAYEELEQLEASWKRSLEARSWRMQDGESSRQVENADPTDLYKLIVKKKKEIEILESRASHTTSEAFCVGVHF